MSPSATKGTLTRLFFDALERHRGLPAALRHKVGDRWVALTHSEVEERVRAVSLGLRELGVSPGDRVSILSENRPEWAIADYACLCARAADVPIYPTLPAKQAEYILRDAGAVAVFCSTAAQLAKVLEVRANLPALRHIIAFDPATQAGVMSFADAGGARSRRGREVSAVPERGARGRARSAGDVDLHVGHHRRPEGRDALAQQSLVERA